MVFPTSRSIEPVVLGQGQGQPEQGQNQDQPQAIEIPTRFPDVYASVRVVKNWELMRIAQETCKEDTRCSQLAYDLLTKERASHLFRDHGITCRGKVEGMYQVLLAWKDKCDGLAFVGDIAKHLRKHGFRDLAESFPP